MQRLESTPSSESSDADTPEISLSAESAAGPLMPAMASFGLINKQPASDNWFSRHRRRLAEIGIGHACYATFNFFFDQILYVFVIYRLGLFLGGVLMALLSLVSCLFVLLIYQRMKIDWVGVGSLVFLERHPNPAWWQRIIVWATRHGSWAIFFALCIFQDPFITTAYFRRGNFDRMAVRDWQIFFASIIVSNLYWTLRSGAVAAIIVGAWRWVAI